MKSKFSLYVSAAVRLLAACLLLFGIPETINGQTPTATFANAQATAASGFGTPYGVAVDGAGNLYVADSLTSEVVKIAAVTGTRTTIGSGFNAPTGIALDSAGDLFVSDGGNDRVVVVPADGGPQFTVGVSGLAGPNGLAIDSAGNLYIADFGNVRVVKVPADGSGLKTIGSGFSSVWGVAVDHQGNVFISDSAAKKVAKVTPGGVQTTVSSGFLPYGLAVDLVGNLFIAGDGGVMEVPAGTATPISVVSGISDVVFVAVDPAGRLFITTGTRTTVTEIQVGSVNFGNVPVCPAAQKSSPGCSVTMTLTYNVTSPAQLYPYSVSTRGVAYADLLLGASTTCGIVTTGSTCTVEEIFTPGAPGLRRSAALIGDQHGNILSAIGAYGNGVGPQIAFYGGTGATTVGKGFNLPSSVVVDGAGDVFVADTFNNQVVEVPANGGAQISMSPDLQLPVGLAIDGLGNLYTSELGAGSVVTIPSPGFGSEFVVVSSLNEPLGLAVDGHDNLYVANTQNNQVVELFANSHTFTTIGTGLSNPSAVAVDGAGNVYIADTTNNRIVKVPADGGAQVALGTGLTFPKGVAVDAAGDVFVSDSGNNRVVEIPADGGTQFTVISGLKQPTGITFDLQNNLYIADTMNNRVLKLASSAPAALHFATTEVGFTSSDSPENLVVQNIGNQQLNITNVVYPVDFPIGFEANGYEDLCTGETSLTPGQVCNLSFNFTPLGPVSTPEQFKITDNTMNVPGSKQSIELIGTAKLPQSIVFLIPSSAPFSPSPTNLSSFAGSTSGLPVTFKLVSGPAKLSGNVMTLTGAGAVVIQASQAGNASYVAAAPVTRTITITKATPAVTWVPPAAIVYGTKLGTAQLDASSSVPGKFVYTPPAGTVLAAGAQTLSVTFTPTNAAGYLSVTMKVKITVAKATLTVSAKSVSVVQGSAIPPLTPTYTGFVNGDTAVKALTGAPSLTTTAKSTSPTGTYLITVKLGTLASKNYSLKLVNGLLTIASK